MLYTYLITAFIMYIFNNIQCVYTYYNNDSLYIYISIKG